MHPFQKKRELLEWVSKGVSLFAIHRNCGAKHNNCRKKGVSCIGTEHLPKIVGGLFKMRKGVSNPSFFLGGGVGFVFLVSVLSGKQRIFMHF